MKKLIIFILFAMLLISSGSRGEEVNAVVWSKNSKAAYNECNFILSFICSMNMDVKSTINDAQIGTQIVVFDKNNKQISTFKVKKIHYEKNESMCWLTDQPIRRFTTYYAVKECKVIK